MRKFLPAILLLLALLPPSAQATVVVARVNGVINTGISQYLKRAVKEAEIESGAPLVVVLNTPGGLLNVTRQILEIFGASPVPVIVYVGPAGASATSAGAILAQGAHIIAMSTGTNMGAAHPVGGQGEDVKGDMKEKVVNDTVAMAQSMARLRGRDSAWIEKAIRASISVAAGDAVKAGAAEFVVSSLDELLTTLDGRSVKIGGHDVKLYTKGQPQKELAMTAGEKILQFLGDPNVTYLLMAAGGIGLYAEMSAPGLSVPGIVAVICFILAFISMQTLPVSTGAVALIAVGVALIIAEIFITSFGLLAVAGVASFTLGALFLLDPSTGDLKVSLALLVPVTAALVVFMAGLGYFLYRTRSRRYSGLDQFEGLVGEVETVDPAGLSGKMHMRGETWDFRIEGGGAVKRGDRVKAASRDGFTVIVHKE
jgi:membrane-bound serine protease (ClpP class)